MKQIKRYKKFTTFAICALLLSACGGGGNGGSLNQRGGSTGISTAEIKYRGPTTPVVITATNAQEIAFGAYSNNEIPVIGFIFASENTPEQADQNLRSPRITTTVQRLLKTVDRIDPATTSQNASARALDTESYDGNCGGTSSYSININDVTGEFTGNYTFRNYCEYGETINGTMSMSGSINSDTGVLGNVSLSFSSLTLSSSISNESLSINGRIDTNLSAVSIVSTVNMQMKDNVTNKTFLAENVITQSTFLDDAVEIQTSGRFYDSDYGYVDVTTPTPLLFAFPAEWPSSGEIIATGANNSKVKLTAISSTTYNIEVDSDGDDLYETQQLGLLWDDM